MKDIIHNEICTIDNTNELIMSAPPIIRQWLLENSTINKGSNKVRWIKEGIKEVEIGHNYGIIPIKDLKNTSEISEMCHKTDEPIYVTKNGYGDMVIMSMEIYESTMRQIAMYRDIELSEKQIEAGQVKDARTALRETRAKYGL